MRVFFVDVGIRTSDRDKVRGGVREPGQNPRASKGEVRKILDWVGVEVEEDKLQILFKEVDGKD